MSTLKTITISLAEIMQLEAELQGVKTQNGEVVFTGLLNQKLPMKTKYWLTRLAEKVSSEKKTIDGLRDEMIKRFGESTDEGQSFMIPSFVDTDKKDADGNVIKQPNPKFKEFNDEYSELLNTEKEISHPFFKFDDFAALETTDTYAVFFKMLNPEEEIPA